MISKVILSGLVIVASLATVARAQVTIDASKITCEQYVFSKVADPRSIALWMSGYYSGKRDTSIVDAQALRTTADRLDRFCRQQKNFKLPVMQAIEQLRGTGN
jgi:acid stress chaperone HdeB